jgi:E3 ubiquitin-protein ligase SspH2
MEIAVERIAHAGDILFLYNLGLTELPPLVFEGKPPTMEILYCGYNALTELPPLPSTLRGLYCDNNALTSLPQLPSTLELLDCRNNALTTLPSLPPKLKVLRCDGNALTELPYLPPTLCVLEWHSNPLQYPPSDICEKGIGVIREWMELNPHTYTKSAYKV